MDLFGDMPLPAKFFIAFIIVLGLIAGVAYLVRRFGSGALNAGGTRGRQPRLAVIEAAAVDSRRRLVLIRRDNVEHLVMLGGPSDVVVECNIVRATPAPAIREAQVARPAAEAIPRAMPAAEGNMWPLAPEPAFRPIRPNDRPIAPVPDELPLQPQTEAPPPRSQTADRLSGLAAELARSAARPEPAPRPAPAGTEAKRQPPPLDPPLDERNLAAMANRLEAALRRPGPTTRDAAEPGAREPRMPSSADLGGAPPARRPLGEPRAPLGERLPPRPAPRPPAAPAQSTSAPSMPAAPAEPAPAPAEMQQAPASEPQAPAPSPAAKCEEPAGKTAYESLEQEMASLLGRPPGKT